MRVRLDRQISFESADVQEIMEHVSREVTLKWFDRLKPSDIDTKAHILDLVTPADREAEGVYTGLLQKLLPGSLMLGEEGSFKNGHPKLKDMSNEAPTWVVDPIDGTRNFAAHLPQFGSVVGLAYKNEFIAGFIHFPVINSTIEAARGAGAFLDGKQLLVNVRGPNGNIYGAMDTELYESKKDNLQSLDGMKLGPAIVSSIDYARMVTALRFEDAVLKQTDFVSRKPDGMKVWDHGAGTLVVREAGGIVRTWEDKEPNMDALTDGMVAACNENVLKRVLKARSALVA